MKYTLVSFILLFHIACWTQSSDVELIEEQSGNEMKLIAKNNTDDIIEVKVSAELIGFITNDANPAILKLDAKETALVMTLTAPKGVSCEYRTSLSYKKVKSATELSNKSASKQRMTSIQMNTSKINVFTQDGCGRCEYVIKYLEDMKIPYVELNTSIHDPNQALMFEILGKAGFKGNSVQMPVVVMDGKTEYNIKDLAKWVKTLNK